MSYAGAMRLLAIDPGPVQSAFVTYNTATGMPNQWRKYDNADMLERLSITNCDRLAVEMIASYGMAVGATVFETCVWIGRFIERWTLRYVPFPEPEPLLVYRKDVKMHLCGSTRAKDANIRQALIDRYGGKEVAVGKKASPGPLHGMAGDCWAALAVAITAAETT